MGLIRKQKSRRLPRCEVNSLHSHRSPAELKACAILAEHLSDKGRMIDKERESAIAANFPGVKFIRVLNSQVGSLPSVLAPLLGL